MPEFPRDRPHLFIPGNGRGERFTTRGTMRTPPPPEQDPREHGNRIAAALTHAITAGRQRIHDRDPELEVGSAGFYLQFELDSRDDVAVEKLENKRQEIELVAVRGPETPDGPISATSIPRL
jgi:hypothetical protein